MLNPPYPGRPLLEAVFQEYKNSWKYTKSALSWSTAFRGVFAFGRKILEFRLQKWLRNDSVEQVLSAKTNISCFPPISQIFNNMYIYTRNGGKNQDFCSFPLKFLENQECVTNCALKWLSELTSAWHFRRFHQNHKFWHCKKFSCAWCERKSENCKY